MLLALAAKQHQRHVNLPVTKLQHERPACARQGLIAPWESCELSPTPLPTEGQQGAAPCNAALQKSRGRPPSVRTLTGACSQTKARLNPGQGHRKALITLPKRLARGDMPCIALLPHAGRSKVRQSAHDYWAMANETRNNLNESICHGNSNMHPMGQAFGSASICIACCAFLIEDCVGPTTGVSTMEGRAEEGAKESLLKYWKRCKLLPIGHSHSSPSNQVACGSLVIERPEIVMQTEVPQDQCKAVFGQMEESSRRWHH